MRIELIVDNGRVGCPRSGDIDVEGCFACADLVKIRNDADGRMTICCRALGNIFRERVLSAVP
jgi:hypothetical protein